MSKNELYNDIKLENKNKIVLIKQGIFYLTYNNDALILKQIFNYKVIDNKLGFPISKISFVLKVLNEVMIDVVVVEDDIITEYNVLNSNYSNYLKSAKLIDKRDKMFNEINHLLKLKINKNATNFKKIKDFLNGL